MKQFIIISILLGRLIACENVTGILNNTSSDSAKAAPVEPLFETTRNENITAENAYSDLFVDSASLESFIVAEKLPDSAAQHLRNFYASRNYQFAWFSSDGFTEQGLSFWNLYNHMQAKRDSTKDKKFYNRMDSLTENDSLQIAPSDSSFTHTELQLTNQFVQYAGLNTTDNFLNGKTLFRFIPVKKTDVMQLADSVLNRQKDTTALSANKQYGLMREQLRKYYSLYQQGGWQPIQLKPKTIKKGISSPAVSAIKKRLQLTRDYSGDSSQVFTDSLEAAIKSYQLRTGFKPTGIISDSLVAVMNIPVEDRIKQLLINMNRMAWMPVSSSERIIEVNIPEYTLSVYQGNTKAFDMEVIVGKEGANTMMFTGNLNQIVFSPYWNIPQSIVKDEIMPAIKSDPDYLRNHKMEIVKKGDSVPEIRQVPGPHNSLGKVKFLFPNTYDIFFHDTPDKELFQNDKRAFSHGCIRLADAEKMAAYLLQDKQKWTSEKIREAMNSGKEQYVALDKPVPVMITYFTAWIDEDGRLNFRDDVYSHDEKTGQRMFVYKSSFAAHSSSDSLSTQKTDSAKTKSL